MLAALGLPPLWLLFFIALAWLLGAIAPWGPEPGLALRLLGQGLIALGVALTALALSEFRRHQTPPIPGRHAAALIRTGPFRWSRNPIYLADALMLTGAVLWMGAWLGLLLVPGFIFVLTKRFILPEEARLSTDFGEEFAAWAAATRRWL